MRGSNTVVAVAIKFPSKLFAFICGIIATVLIITALVSPVWLTAEGWRQGLFQHCIEQNVPVPLPFGVADPPGCHPIVDHTYIRASAVFCILSLLANVCGAALAGLGLVAVGPGRKYKYYKLAFYVMSASLISVIVPLIMYPICLINKLSEGEGNRGFWDVGWAYSIGWDAVGFLLASVFFLLFDLESELVYYKEEYIPPELPDFPY